MRTWPPFIGALLSLSIALLIGCSYSPRLESWPAPGPLARDIPAFQASSDANNLESTAVGLVRLAPVETLSLAEALVLALNGNPQLRATAWEIRDADARILQSRAYPNPELSLRIDHLGRPFDAYNLDESRARAILSEDVELGGKRGRRIDLARAEREVAGATFELNRSQIAGMTMRRFLDVLGSQRRVACLDTSVAALKRAVDLAALRWARGTISEIEMRQAERILGLTRIDLSRAEAQLSASRQRLTVMWNGERPHFGRAVGDLDSPAEIPDLDRLLAITNDGPRAAWANAELARSRAQIAEARADRWPDVGVGAGIRVEKSEVGPEILFDFDIPVPLIDRKQATVLEARYDLAHAAAEAEQELATLRDDITREYQDLAASSAEIRILETEILPSVRVERGAIERAFLEDAADVNDMMGAIRDLARTELRHIDALEMYAKTRATIEGLLGRPISAPAEGPARP